LVREGCSGPVTRSYQTPHNVRLLNSQVSFVVELRWQKFSLFSLVGGRERWGSNGCRMDLTGVVQHLSLLLSPTATGSTWTGVFFFGLSDFGAGNVFSGERGFCLKNYGFLDGLRFWLGGIGLLSLA